jgi:hypothetical protein
MSLGGDEGIRWVSESALDIDGAVRLVRPQLKRRRCGPVPSVTVDSDHPGPIWNSPQEHLGVDNRGIVDEL